MRLQQTTMYMHWYLPEQEKNPFVAGADIAEMKDKSVEEAAACGKFGNEKFRKIETLPLSGYRCCKWLCIRRWL